MITKPFFISEKQNATKLDTSLLPLNHSKILIPYIQAMAAAPFALEAVQLEKNDKVWNILDIGLGTGILNSFLHNVFSKVSYVFFINKHFVWTITY